LVVLLHSNIIRENYRFNNLENPIECPFVHTYQYEQQIKARRGIKADQI